MKKFSLYLVFVFIITFIQTQRPKNIRIFNVGEIFKHGKLFYEYTVFKNEIFAFQFENCEGTGYHWYHLNDSEPKTIELVNMTFHSWRDDIVPITQAIFIPPSNENITITVEEKFEPKTITGGPYEKFEIYKALNVTGQPELLHFINRFDGREALIDVSVNIWVCDEVYKDQCIDNETMKCIYIQKNNSCVSKTLCDKVETASEYSCQNAVTSTPSLTKCIYEKTETGETNICDEIDILLNGGIIGCNLMVLLLYFLLFI